MVQKVGPNDFDLIIKFGGGLHTRAAEDDIDAREAAGGKNFLLDLERRELKPRPPFDLIGTVPNEGAIKGGGSLLKADGTVAAFFQGGTSVYEWDGSSFTASPVLDTVNVNAKLRAHWHRHAWTLTSKVLVTDIGLQEPVMEWDGSTWQDVTFYSDSAHSTPFGSAFKAKYLHIANERAIFGNVVAGSATPHLLVGSLLDDYQVISITDRPSSSLSAADPWFLTSPNLKPINGMVEAFQAMALSTEKGQLYRLNGADATDFAMNELYAGSGAAGTESLEYIGNDIIYGRPGRVESVKDTDRFGDTEADDLTRTIADQVAAYTGWTTVYNSRLNRVYLFPSGQSEVWVFQTAMRDASEVSPWMRWTTAHDLAFQPTFVASMLDPSDGLEYVFMGDSSGNVYRMEGTGTDGDAGSQSISTEWLSRLFSVELNAQVYGIEGYIKYRKAAAATVDLVFEFAGTNIFNEMVTVSIPAAQGGRYFGSGIYYGGGYYFGTVSGRLSRQPFGVPGQSNEFQVRVKSTGTADFAISEIGLRFRASG